MKVIGMVVRKATQSGVPIGPYLVVKKITKDWITCSRLSDNLDVELLRENVYTPPLVKVVVPQFVMDRVIAGEQRAIIHDLTPMWQKIIDTHAELILLHSRKYTKVIRVFTLDGVSNVYYRRKKQIRILLGEKVCQKY